MITGKSIRTIAPLKGVKARSVFTIGNSTAGDLTPINLLATTLDRRITYNGPAHSYMAADGTIKQSAANAWPLEFSAGVAVGRHEPEPAATNQIKDPFFTNYVVSAGAVVDQWSAFGGGLGSVQATGGINNGPALNTTSGYFKGGVFDGTAFLVPDTVAWDQQVINGDANAWRRLRMSANFAAAAPQGRFYIARQDSTNYVYHTFAIAAGDNVFSEFRLPWTGTGANFRHSWPQAEKGLYSTSPVNGTRAASSVKVAKQIGAVGITVYFTDGTNRAYPFDSTDGINLALSASHWGTRYISRIEYR